MFLLVMSSLRRPSLTAMGFLFSNEMMHTNVVCHIIPIWKFRKLSKVVVVLQKLPWVAYLFFTRLILLLLLGATAASYGLWTNTLKLKLHCNLHNIFLSKTVNQSPRGSHVIWWKRNEKIWSSLLQKISSHTIPWIIIEFSMASNKKLSIYNLLHVIPLKERAPSF